LVSPRGSRGRIALNLLPSNQLMGVLLGKIVITPNSPERLSNTEDTRDSPRPSAWLYVVNPFRASLSAPLSVPIQRLPSRSSARVLTHNLLIPGSFMYWRNVTTFRSDGTNSTSAVINPIHNRPVDD